ncbi:DUF11 domain-containing protein [Micromonospora inositola]|uniref:Conserved repeat domain-containing protein n=1 Tax=Micromonospora inositola TaxID=47865 RepID=A0A1C5HUU5_9ACTN|nr:DUF11 domain-containing protein [Micromonospora inositola]SCG49825.1 conserved repeat domain-containing protein [Micromonospora inositola]
MSVHSRSTRQHLLRSSLAVGALAALGTGLLPAAPAGAAPARTDLVVGTSVDPVEVPAGGGSSTLTLDLRNSGTKASQDVTVAFTLPAGTWFFTDGFVVPPSWHCDLLGTATCSYAPLAAGEVADTLSIPFGIPAGTAGDTLTITATASTRMESSLTNNTGQATVHYIPSTVDLDFVPAATTQQLLPNEQAQLVTSVRNTGNSPSGEVTVTTPVPAGMRGWETYNEGWDCAFGNGVADGRTGWRCVHGPLQPGQTSEPLTFAADLTDTTVGDIVTLEATASTTSTETILDNNMARDTVTVEQGATVRGTVWVDNNRNGVRDANEGGAPVGNGGIDHIELIPQTSGQPGYTVTVNPDGTYVAYARPGTYRAEFYVQDPHEFIDSVDSDLIYHWNETGGYNNYGYTDWFTVTTSDQVTLDAGVN